MKNSNFGPQQQSALILKMANSGSTKADTVKALVAKGLTDKAAQVTLNYFSELEQIAWRGKGAQGWRELMTAKLKASPKMTQGQFRKILDANFPAITEKRRTEYTRYYYPMMSELVQHNPNSK